MKIVAIGDIHGRTLWKQIVEQELGATREVFIGDYFDTWAKITAEEQIKNFEEIIAYRRANPERVVVLMGNHDFHYITEGERYGGYQDLAAKKIGKVVLDAVMSGDIQMAFAEGGYLFTHAGVTKTWCEKVGITGMEAKPLPLIINELPGAVFCFNRADLSGCGEHVSQSPIWVRPDSLMQDKIPGWKQVVGHTTFDKVQFLGGVILIDTLGEKKYLVIEDDRAFEEEVL